MCSRCAEHCYHVNVSYPVDCPRGTVRIHGNERTDRPSKGKTSYFFNSWLICVL